MTAPAWLVELQRQFAATLATPLDRDGGSLAAPTGAYPPTLIKELASPGRARLAVYHRQVWYRLLEALQTMFPVTARLLGAWAFNGVAADYLATHPPRHWQLDGAVEGFGPWLAAELDGRGPALLAGAAAPGPSLAPRVPIVGEGLQLDLVWRRVFLAPPARALQLTMLAAPDLARIQLRRSSSVALHRERWPVLDLRGGAASDAPGPVAVPEPHPVPRSWLLLRTGTSVGQVPLHPFEAALLEALAEVPVGEALERLESLASAADPARLAADVQRWLRRSVELGVWAGVDAPAASTSRARS